MMSVPMSSALDDFRRGVRDAIADAHAHGVPVFQIKDGFIVAVYPGGREVALERVTLPAANDEQRRDGSAQTAGSGRP
jgi:hypothetical protein